MAKAPFLALEAASWELALTSAVPSEYLLIYRVCTLSVRRQGEYRGTALCKQLISLVVYKNYGQY